jgi:predicted phosphodiesterase
VSDRKIVALFDCHVPFNIPLGPVFEFIQDFKPTEIILGGDVHDWTAVCAFVTDQSRALDGGTLAENYVALTRTVLQPCHKAAPKAKIVYLVGNHEDWLRKAANADPNLRGFIELEENLPKDIQIIPVNQAYHVNEHLCYLHGLYTTKYHAFQTVHAVHKTVLYGHTHDVQRYTDISPVDISQFYTGASCGCLCTMNPSYLKNRPNRWVNGFNFAYVDDKTKEFSETQVYIIRNKFWANGRRYK